MSSPEEEPLKTQTETEKLTIIQKIRRLKENITLEPILICYIMPNVLARLAIQTLYLDKACRVNLGYGDKICDALVAKEGDKYKMEEKAVQELIAAMEGWKNLLLTAIPSILILFFGAWSDRTGKRKFCIVLPLCGDLLMSLNNILSTYFFYEIPVQVSMFLEAFLPAITGGWVLIFLGAFSYIGDVSTEETRTFRVGLANLCLTAGTPLGSVLSGIFLKTIGYYGVFITTSVLYLFSIGYGILYIQDPERPKQKEKEQDQSSIQFLKNFFDIQHVKDTLTVAFKKGPNNRRIKSILVLASIAFIYGPSYGEYTVRYLFTRYKFNWDALKYSFYNTFYICMHAIGALISISVFSKYLRWDDSVLGLISSLSKFVGSIATGLAKTGTDMYIAVAIETFNATSFTALRSISSKLVKSNELGKMIAVFNLTEVVTSMVFGPIYSWVYMATLEIDVGIVYYMSTVLTVPSVMIFTWFFIQHRKLSKKTTQSNDINGEKEQCAE